ncbi:hypothetical protein [Pseudomonas sp. LS-2]|uniref:hypothetical protein n=1 Tax=Pseudomonas sp. LS-2 TaxID=2315859 RepID=UPI000E73EBE2|nr:hypothetical protein [Pseudomonas sp. LS-2]RJX72641.1 hypothetical protein D3M70_31055 [Pseudomonas sp. LS-2]
MSLFFAVTSDEQDREPVKRVLQDLGPEVARLDLTVPSEDLQKDLFSTFGSGELDLSKQPEKVVVLIAIATQLAKRDPGGSALTLSDSAGNALSVSSTKDVEAFLDKTLSDKPDLYQYFVSMFVEFEVLPRPIDLSSLAQGYDNSCAAELGFCF